MSNVETWAPSPFIPERGQIPKARLLGIIFASNGFGQYRTHLLSCSHPAIMTSIPEFTPVTGFYFIFCQLPIVVERSWNYQFSNFIFMNISQNIRSPQTGFKRSVNIYCRGISPTGIKLLVVKKRKSISRKKVGGRMWRLKVIRTYVDHACTT